MDLFSCPNCERQGISYTFVKTQKEFNDSINDCKSRGGTLVNNIDLETYEHLDNCCNDNQVRGLFWIGLKREKGSNPAKYRWINEDGSVDISPLSILNPETNDFECRAVVIELKTQNNMPKANEFSCKNKNPYICQKAESTQPASHSILLSTQKTVLNTEPNSTEATTTSSTLPVPTTETFQKTNAETNHAPLIASIILVGLLLFLLFIFLCRYKKIGFKSFRSLRCFSLPQNKVENRQNNKEIQINSIYTTYDTTNEDPSVNPSFVNSNPNYETHSYEYALNLANQEDNNPPYQTKSLKTTHLNPSFSTENEYQEISLHAVSADENANAYSQLNLPK